MENLFGELASLWLEIDKGSIYVQLSNQTNSDRVKIMTDHLKQKCLLPSEKILKEKSQVKSLELRHLGNEAFLNKHYKEASALYTKSIAAAPFPATGDTETWENADDSLAIAFANRSAVLFCTEKYKLCLNDITEALKYNYPKRLVYKLYQRQGKCLHYLGKKKEAIQSLENALKWLPSAVGLTQDNKEVIELELQELLKCFESTKTSPKCCNVEQPPIPKCSYNRNQKMPCASDCVEVKYSAEMGRYVSATRDIQPGDVLVVEKPFASFLSPEHFDTHCFNCLQHSEVLIPCCFCSNVFDSYGFLHYDQGKAERISQLKLRYFFECKCHACIEDWPTFTALSATQPAFICNRCKQDLPKALKRGTVTCKNCNKTHNIAKTYSKLLLAEDYYDRLEHANAREHGTNWNKIAQKIVPFLLFLHENMKRPSVEHYECEYIFKKCIAMTGDHHRYSSS